MIDWNHEILFRCTACETDYAAATTARRCHMASVVASVECDICGRSYQDPFIKNAVQAADACCRAELRGDR